MAEENTEPTARAGPAAKSFRSAGTSSQALQAAGSEPLRGAPAIDVTHHAQEIKDHFDALEGRRVSVWRAA